MSSRRIIMILAGLGVLLALGVVLRLTVSTGFALGWPDQQILQIRLSRVASAIVVGSALALAGVFLQTLLRNPLASPDLLGLSSGAGLGVILAAYLVYISSGQIAPTGSLGGGFGSIAAVIGSGVTLAIVYTLSQRRGFVDPFGLVLIGVIVGVMAGAMTQLVQRLLPDGGIAIGRLLIGTLPDDVPAWLIGINAVLVGGVGVVACRLGPQLDALAMDDDEARSVGVRVGLVRASLLAASGLLTAGSVMIAGPIGFVGLVVPHAVRLVLGPGHRTLVIGVVLLGGAALVLADVIVAGVRLPSGRLPVGVVTAIVGGPVFVALLRRVMRD